MQHPTADAFIDQLLQSTALAVHDAEQRYEAVMATAPEAPKLLGDHALSADDDARIGDYVAAYGADRDQRDAAKAEWDHARAAHRAAVRLATGHDPGIHGASVVAYVVNRRGAAWVTNTSRTAPCPQAPRATRPARRGGGRPRAGATSSSAASGDSPDSDEPPPPAPLRLWRHPCFGRVTPNLLRALLRAARREQDR